LLVSCKKCKLAFEGGAKISASIPPTLVKFISISFIWKCIKCGNINTHTELLTTEENENGKERLRSTFG
jgi:predicted nucleic-acid-binding Zn-ribbon protein